MPKTITWNGVSSAGLSGFAVETIDRDMVGEYRGVDVYVAGRAGSYNFPEEHGDREIVAHCYVLKDDITGRRPSLVEVGQWLGSTTGKADLVFSDEPDRLWVARYIGVPRPEEWRQLGQFDLVWKCEPYAYDSDISTDTHNDTGGSPASDSVTAGTAADPEISIRPTNGTITSLQFLLGSAEITWQWGTASPDVIGSGEAFTISSISDTVLLGSSSDMSLLGVFDPDDVSMAQSTVTGFPELVQGSNPWTLNYTGTASEVTVEFSWRERAL